jgi:hypothetical protein
MKLTQDVRPKAPCPPSAHLFQQVNKAKQTEGMAKRSQPDDLVPLGKYIHVH